MSVNDTSRHLQLLLQCHVKMSAIFLFQVLLELIGLLSRFIFQGSAKFQVQAGEYKDAVFFPFGFQSLRILSMDALRAVIVQLLSCVLM